MGINISDFKEAFNGGTRLNRFFVEANIPFGNGQISKFHITTTTIPSTTTSRIEYQYFGRRAYYPGEKSYGSWSVTVLDDTSTDGNLWKKFSNWQNRINNHVSNVSFMPTQQSDYKASNWKIYHLNLNGEANPSKTFILHGCWPKSIEPIPFNMEMSNKLVNFNVTFVYDSIEIDGITDR